MATSNRVTFEKLQTWLSSELGISVAESHHSSDHKTEIVGTTELRKMWKHVMANVHSTDYINLVSDNLKLHKLELENMDADLELLDKLSQVRSLDTDIKDLEAQLKSLKVSCFNSELEIAQLQKESESLNHKSLFYKTDARKSQDLSSQTASLQEKFHIHQQVLDKRMKYDDVKEGSCVVEVKELIALIKEHYEKCLESNSPFSESYRHLASQVVNIVEKFPACDVLSVLCSIADEEGEKVVQCEKDASRSSTTEKLDCQEETPSMAIKKLLREHNVSSLKELTYIKGADKSIKLNQEKIKEIAQRLQNIIQDKYKLNADQQDLAIKILEAEMHLAGLQATFQSFEESAHDLQEEFKEKTKVNDQHKKVLAELKNFKSILDKNQYQMIVTTKQNSAFRSGLKMQQTDAFSTTTDLLQEQLAVVDDVTTTLPKSMQSKLQAFNDADMLKMLTANVDRTKVPVYDLSIHRSINTDHCNGGLAYQNIASSLLVCSMKFPSDFLDKICNQKAISQMQNSFHDLVSTREDRIQESSDSFNSLLEQLRASDLEQTTSTLPEIARGQKAVETVQGEITKLQAALEEWADQPAQHCIPWVKFGGATLAELNQTTTPCDGSN